MSIAMDVRRGWPTQSPGFGEGGNTKYDLPNFASGGVTILVGTVT